MFGILKRMFVGGPDVAENAGSPAQNQLDTMEPVEMVNNKPPYIVIGAGPAGVKAVETLRVADPEREIVLIGGEPEPPYSRMAIPYVLTEEIEEVGTYLRKRDGHFDGLGVTYMHGRVTGVSPENKTITLVGGAERRYQGLLIATGANPIKPPVTGLDLPGVSHCWTLADSRKIIEKADKGADVVLMGAGFIGSIILQALVDRGVNLTVIEAEDRMVPRMMNQIAGGLIKSWCEGKGVTVLTSTRVEKIADSGDRLTVSLDSGAEIPANLVVVAAGVRSNVDFLDGSGIEIESGIVVDDHLKSSVEGVYAAGDCAQGPDINGGWAVHAIQTTAVEHGRIAALNMAGLETEYRGSLSMNVLDTLGLISASFGAWQGVEGGDHVEVVESERHRYLRLEFDGDRLVGALSLGRTEHIGVLRGLIQGKVALGGRKEQLINNPHRLMDVYVRHVHG